MGLIWSSVPMSLARVDPGWCDAGNSWSFKMAVSASYREFVLEDAEELAQWVTRALEVAASKPREKKAR